VTTNKGLSHQFGETVYISELITCENQIKRAGSYEQELRPRAETVSLSVPQLNFFKRLKLSETSRARKLISRLHVNIHVVAMAVILKKEIYVYRKRTHKTRRSFCQFADSENVK